MLMKVVLARSLTTSLSDNCGVCPGGSVSSPPSNQDQWPGSGRWYDRSYTWSATVCLFLSAVILMATSAFSAGPGDVLGPWKTDGGDSWVELFRCGEAICGTIISPKGPEDIDSRYGRVGKAEVDCKNPDPALRNRPIIGMEIMKGFTAKGDNQWGSGICYNPESGKSYKCKMHIVSPDRLELRGYIWIPFFGRTVVLTR